MFAFNVQYIEIVIMFVIRMTYPMDGRMRRRSRPSKSISSITKKLC